MAIATNSVKKNRSGGGPDTEKFRLRRFIEKLLEMGEVEVHDEPVELAQISTIVEATPKAVLFRRAGPERLELVANVMGSGSRLAAALGVTEAEAAAEFQRRLDRPQPVLDVSSSEAPVHQVILMGEQADFTRLPFHPQHEYDGSVYISSAIDYTIDPESGLTNVGCRRLSLRGRSECGTNVTARSHLKMIYQRCVARGEKLPISFAVGSHPIDFMASLMRIRQDEVNLIATLRGEPVPLVKCLTNDIRVPADAELIIEGYLDERGYIEPEGPYGEYMGYYGPMHLDPVFHLTAMTMRRDVLHQTVLHGSGKVMGRTESANLTAIRIEAEAFQLLKNIGIEVVGVHLPVFGGEGQHLRIAIRQTMPGQARRAIAAIFSAMLSVKHVFVVDEDIDVRSDEQMDWALGTRFQADRDMVLVQGVPGMTMDPSLEGRPIGAKAGFDLTRPFGRKPSVKHYVAGAKRFGGEARYKTVAEALTAGPHFFTHIMESVGSRDGREVALALDELRREGRLGRDADGRYHLAPAQQGRTAIVGPMEPDPNMP